jgi:MinD-like ATPase involved in chromosome partitioning or flagellar assembly
MDILQNTFEKHKKLAISKVLMEAAKDEADKIKGTTTSAEDYRVFDDVPSVRIHIDDAEEKPRMFAEIGPVYHSGDNGKVEVLKKDKALQEKLAKRLQKDIQEAFRKAVHELVGEPNDLK